MFGALARRLDERAAAGRPLRVGIVGAGVFGTMLLAQLRRLRGIELTGVADLDPARAAIALDEAGYGGDVPVTTDPLALIGERSAEVIVEATGSPSAGVEHALAAIEAGGHVVMVTVEADALAGPVLAERARAAGVVYTLAYGDQPALVCELVDWARTTGFDVVCAGKGTRFLPAYRRATPDTVWAEYGLTPEQVAAGRLNARMFTSFLDGTKSAVEMASVCNATGLTPPAAGLGFPPCGTGDLARVCIPAEHGGTLAASGTVEVVSSLERDGSPVAGDLRFGVFLTFAAPGPVAARAFRAYGLATDASGSYAALYRPYHLIGLETSVSVLSAGLLGEATGFPVAWHADVVAAAKRDLAPGSILDGEGGYSVVGRLVPAADSLAAHALPIGLAHGARLRSAVPEGGLVRRDDVTLPASPALGLRAELERRS